MDVAPSLFDSLAHVFAVSVGLEIDMRVLFRNYTLCHALRLIMFGLLKLSLLCLPWNFCLR
jgi:hypothetical protein